MSLYIQTLAEAKADLGLTDTADDAVLTRHMEGLQGRFELYCHREFLRAERDEVISGGESQVLVKAFPVESVSGVWISPQQSWTDATKLGTGKVLVDQQRGQLVYFPSPPFTPVMATDYFMSWGLPQITDVTKWPTGFRNVRVVYTGGYVAAGTSAGTGQFAMPEALRRAFGLQLGFEWRNRSHLGKNGFSGNGVNVQISPVALLPDVKDTLDHFSRMVV